MTTLRDVRRPPGSGSGTIGPMDDHDHGGHEHGQLDSPRDRSAKRTPLAIALGITTVFLIVEIVGGIAANSLALLADAGHMATDAGALVLSLVAAWRT